MSNIHNLNVAPAQHKQTYEGFTIVVTFEPNTRRWGWVATMPVQSKIVYTGIAGTRHDAFGAAKRKIDSA